MIAGQAAAVMGVLLGLAAIARAAYRAARALEFARDLLRLLTQVAADHEDRITKGEQGQWESQNVSQIGPRTAAGGSPPRRS